MTEDQGESLGEISRSIKRIETSFATHQAETRTRFHELANTMNAAVGPISVHTARIEQIDKHLEATDAKVERVQLRAAYLSGAIAGAGVFVNWLLGRH